jgi:hypothetical protein
MKTDFGLRTHLRDVCSLKTVLSDFQGILINFLSWIVVFRVVTPCTLLGCNQLHGVTTLNTTIHFHPFRNNPTSQVRLCHDFKNSMYVRYIEKIHSSSKKTFCCFCQYPGLIVGHAGPSPEEGCSISFRNAGIYPQAHAALQPIRPTATSSAPWEPEISSFFYFSVQRSSHMQTCNFYFVVRFWSRCRDNYLGIVLSVLVLSCLCYYCKTLFQFSRWFTTVLCVKTMGSNILHTTRGTLKKKTKVVCVENVGILLNVTMHYVV